MSIIRQLKENSLFSFFLIVWLFCEVLINPIGEFPLNDDWAYCRDVHTFISSGEIKLTDWQAIPFITQLLYGSIFSIPFGFSFTALRISTIIASLIGLIYAYKISLSITNRKSFSLLAVLLIGFNPIYFQLTNTFMSDVPFLTLALITAYNYILYEKISRKKYLYGALLFSLLCTMNRQTGIIVPLAFSLSWLFQKGLNTKNLIFLILNVLLPFAFLFFFEVTLRNLSALPSNYGYQLAIVFNSVLHPTFGVIKTCAFYLFTATISIGIFIFPLSFSFLFTNNIKSILNLKLGGIIILFLYLFCFVGRQTLWPIQIPFAGNIIYNLGLGPIILPDWISYEVHEMRAVEKIFWLSISIIGFIGFSAFLVHLFRNARSLLKLEQNGFNFIFFSLTILLFIVPLSFVYISDRYLIFILTFTIFVYQSLAYPTSDFPQKKYVLSAAFVFIPTIYFSIAATHDYLAFNRKRWEALNFLIKTNKISPKEIDGGFEFNSWYLFDPAKYDLSKKKWWWVEKDNYAVTIENIDGYRMIKKYSYKKWLTLTDQPLYILKKVNL